MKLLRYSLGVVFGSAALVAAFVSSSLGQYYQMAYWDVLGCYAGYYGNNRTWQVQSPEDGSDWFIDYQSLSGCDTDWDIWIDKMLVDVGTDPFSYSMVLQNDGKTTYGSWWLDNVWIADYWDS